MACARTLMAAFARARIAPRIVAEVDGLALLMDAVRAGHGATIQPGAATARQRPTTTCSSRRSPTRTWAAATCS